MTDMWSPNVRLTDADRVSIIEQLTRHAAEGRLTAFEAEERMAIVADAQTRGDLVPVLADLPVIAAPVTRPVAPSRPGPPRRPPGAGPRMAVRLHAYFYVMVIVFLILIWLFTTPGGYFWPVWPALGMGLALAIHAGFTRAVLSARGE